MAYDPFHEWVCCEVNDTRRMFFALWPDEGVRRGIADLSRAVVERGRPVPTENLHLTLEFLGNVEPDAVDAALAAAAEVRGQPFQLHLDVVGHWRRSRILWLGSQVPSPGLLNLQADLQRRLKEAGLSLEARPFRPHITLARRVPACHQMRVEPIVWPLREFVLMESAGGAAGVRYEIADRWPLVEATD